MLVIFILITWTVCVHAEISEAETQIKFSQGVDAYKKGDYAQAIENFEGIIKGKRESVSIYFNLGNSYFRSGKLGKSILNYERALKLMPRDSDLNFNYQYAINRVKQVEQDQSKSMIIKIAEQQTRYYTVGELVFVMTSLIILIGAFFLSSLYISQLKSAARTIMIFLTIVEIVLIASLMIKIGQAKNAAILLQDAQAKFEPRTDATTHYEIFEGSSVKVVGLESDWVKIKRFDGKLGWIPKSTVEEIDE